MDPVGILTIGGSPRQGLGGTYLNGRTFQFGVLFQPGFFDFLLNRTKMRVTTRPVGLEEIFLPMRVVEGYPKLLVKQ